MSLSGRIVGLVEDDPIMGESLVHRLALEGSVVRWWRSGEEALEQLGRGKPDVIVCDIRLPGLSGDEVFRRVAREGAAPPFLFITAFGEVDQAVGLIRAGAGDYLTKPFEMPDFLARLTGLMPDDADAGAALGGSLIMRDVAKAIAKMARLRTTVLFQGETGTGKEVAARMLHELGGAERPFIAVNCAAIPGELMEAELFGHEKGAFTGAQGRHLGYAERAGTGTLFLDEIADLSAAMQSKLLRLLEERRFFRVGGERSVEFAARVVCATNADLQKRVAEGLFREDLFYRVNVVTISIPPLRDRPSDIPALMERFFDAFNQTVEADLRGISPLAEEAALLHAWPGNVRELRNRVERAVAMASGPVLMPSDLFPESATTPSADPEMMSLEEAREDAERRHIARALKKTGNEMAQTAKLLGISRTTLWEKMRRLGLQIS